MLNYHNVSVYTRTKQNSKYQQQSNLSLQCKYRIKITPLKLKVGKKIWENEFAKIYHAI